MLELWCQGNSCIEDIEEQCTICSKKFCTSCFVMHNRSHANTGKAAEVIVLSGTESSPDTSPDTSLKTKAVTVNFRDLSKEGVEDRTDILKHEGMATKFKYDKNKSYNTKHGKVYVYTCIEHINCRVVRKCVPIGEPPIWWLKESVDIQHNILQNPSRQQHGIDPRLTDEVDRLHRFRVTPKVAQKQLISRAKDLGLPKATVPEAKQISNRFDYRRRSGIPDIPETADQVRNRLRSILLKSKEEFDAIPADKENDMIVLRVFDYEVHHRSFAQPVIYPGFVFTSKKLITQLATMVPAQRYELSLNLDGTHGVLENGWIMYVLSFLALTRMTDTTKYSMIESFAHSCRPFLYAFGRTENSKVTEEMLHAFIFVVSDILQYGPYSQQWRVVTVTIDHAPWLKSAILVVFGNEVWIIDCWAHVMRKCGSSTHLARLVDKEYWKIIKNQLLVCHKAANLSIFGLLSKAMIEDWKAKGETAYADLVGSTYLSNWGSWTACMPLPTHPC